MEVSEELSYQRHRSLLHFRPLFGAGKAVNSIPGKAGSGLQFALVTAIPAHDRVRAFKHKPADSVIDFHLELRGPAKILTINIIELVIARRELFGNMFRRNHFHTADPRHVHFVHHFHQYDPGGWL